MYLAYGFKGCQVQVLGAPSGKGLITVLLCVIYLFTNETVIWSLNFTTGCISKKMKLVCWRDIWTPSVYSQPVARNSEPSIDKVDEEDVADMHR